MNPTDELVKAAKAMVAHLDTDSFDPAFGGETHRLRENLRAAIGPAKAYAERMGEVVGAARAYIEFHGGTLPVMGNPFAGEKVAKALLASLDASGTATVGPDAEGGTTSPDAIREAKREAWDECWHAFRKWKAADLANDVAPGSVPYLPFPTNPYVPPTATAKERE